MSTAAPASSGSVDFGRAFTSVTEDPDWIKKVLIGGAFVLLSSILVGIPFVLGYVGRTLRNVVAGAARPLPEWDDLGGIFSEGLRLAAVYLVVRGRRGGRVRRPRVPVHDAGPAARRRAFERVRPVTGGRGDLRPGDGGALRAVHARLARDGGLRAGGDRPCGAARRRRRRLRLARGRRLHQGEPRQLPPRRSSSTSPRAFSPSSASSSAASGSSRRSSGATSSSPTPSARRSA